MSDAIRLQRVVPAENGGNEAVPAIAERPIPADGDSGESKAVESPQPVEALVADLEAAFCRARDEWMQAEDGSAEELKAFSKARQAAARLQAERRRSATGGNVHISDREGETL